MNNSPSLKIVRHAFTIQFLASDSFQNLNELNEKASNINENNSSLIKLTKRITEILGLLSSGEMKIPNV